MRLVALVQEEADLRELNEQASRLLCLLEYVEDAVVANTLVTRELGEDAQHDVDAAEAQRLLTEA